MLNGCRGRGKARLTEGASVAGHPKGDLVVVGVALLAGLSGEDRKGDVASIDFTLRVLVGSLVDRLLALYDQLAFALLAGVARFRFGVIEGFPFGGPLGDNFILGVPLGEYGSTLRVAAREGEGDEEREQNGLVLHDIVPKFVALWCPEIPGV